MNEQDLINRLITWTLLVVSLTVHEWAHAWSAYKLGDDTAEQMGRMTFNPLVHLDIFGTVILPLMGAPIGWAKPVPVRPDRFRQGISPSWGMLLTAIAGPASNIVLAMLGMSLYAGATHFANSQPAAFEAAETILQRFVLMNLALALFNMIPIPPLDGSRVLNHFMPYAWRPAWHQFEQYSLFILLGLILLMRATETNMLAGPIVFLYGLLFRAVMPFMA
ncbi:MAG TPA: site-2 protease family protein [Caulifigura sp.]|jgi:Zn-dependent protease|nr:site-2 protease family protein [Caulifigura sp.]